MNRRELLVTVATAASTGCVHEDEEMGVDSRFSGEDCPSFRGSEEVRCYHEVGRRPDVYIVPEKEEGDPRDEIMSFTLHNKSGRKFETNFYDWRIDKLVDGDWVKIVPWFLNLPLYTLEPGDSHGWRIETDYDVYDGERVEAGERTATLRHPGPGTYAFSTQGRFDEEPGRVELVVLFQMEGDGAEFGPVGVEEVETEDGVKTVRLEKEDGVKTVRLEKEDGVEDEAELLVRESNVSVDEAVPREVALQFDIVLNSITLFEDEIDELRIRGGVKRLAGFELLRAAIVGTEESWGAEVERDGRGGVAFEYDGRTYEAFPAGVNAEPNEPEDS